MYVVIVGLGILSLLSVLLEPLFDLFLRVFVSECAPLGSYGFFVC